MRRGDGKKRELHRGKKESTKGKTPIQGWSYYLTMEKGEVIEKNKPLKKRKRKRSNKQGKPISFEKDPVKQEGEIQPKGEEPPEKRGG